MTVFIRLLLIIAILSVIIILLLLLHFGYYNSLFYFAQFAKTLDRLDLLKKIIPVSFFTYIVAAICFVLVILLVLLKKFEIIYPLVANIAVKAKASNAVRWRNDWSGHLLYLMIIPVSASVYYTFKMPVSLDEAYMYNYFSSRSFLSSVSYYPSPNNHVLHTLLTNIFLILPFSDTVCIRIPSVLASILCLLFLFSFVKEYYNKYIAYTTIAVCSTLSMTVYYSFMSRGYALQCLFFILMTYSIFKVIGQPQNKIYWLYFCLSGILGLYTMPCFLYPLIIGNIFLLIKLKGIAKYHILSILCIAVVTVSLYLPIIAVNDIRSLVNSFPVAPIQRTVVIKRVLPFFYESYINITGLPFIFIFSALCAGLVISIIKYRVSIGWFFFLILIISPLSLIIQSVIPFSRTFEYYNCIFSLFIAILLFEIFKKYASTRYYFAGLIVIQALLLYNSNRQIMQQEKYSMVTHDVLPKIVSGRSFFIYSPGFDLYLNFYFRERNISGRSFVIRTDDSIKLIWILLFRGASII
jgi:uncharacterized membrane protein